MILKKEIWKEEDYSELIHYINSISDSKYRGFQEKIIPGVKDIIGVRIPDLRKIAKEISKGNWKSFLQVSRDIFYEEVILQGIVIGNIKGEYEDLEKYIKYFVPKINNWCICDTFCSGLKQTKEFKNEMLDLVNEYIYSQNPWEVRFAIVITLEYFVNDVYIDDIFNKCDNIKSDEYYVKMAIAWLISVCFIKYEDITMKYLLNNLLDDFTYNKSLQKILESNRVDKKTKDTIRNMKRRA